MSGQGIAEGDTLVVPLLQRGDFEVGGPGATLVATRLDATSTPPKPLKRCPTHLLHPR